MGMYLRLLPDVRVRITKRGTRWSVGQRTARIWEPLPSGPAGKPVWRGRHVIPRPGGRVTLSGEGIRHETNGSRLRGPGRACPGRVQQRPVIPGFAA